MQIIFIGHILLVCPYSASHIFLTSLYACWVPSSTSPFLSCLMWSERLRKMCCMTVQLSFFLFMFYCWHVLPTFNCKLCEVANCLWFFTSILTVLSPQTVFIVLSTEFFISPCVSRFIPGTLASGLFIHSFTDLYPMWRVWISGYNCRVPGMSHFFVSLNQI